MIWMPGAIQRIAFRRTLRNKFYKDTGDIQRQILVDNQRGGKKPANPDDPWPAIKTNVKTNVEPVRITPRESGVDLRVTMEGKFDIEFPAETDIRNRDRYKCSTLNDRVFRIIGPRYAKDEISRVMAAEEVI